MPGMDFACSSVSGAIDPVHGVLPNVLAELDVSRLLQTKVGHFTFWINLGRKLTMAITSSEYGIPDSKLARAVTEFIRDTETELLFNHSSRVYHFGALSGVHRAVKFDRELLYTGCMFHDIGLMRSHSSKTERFEVDGGAPPPH